jgi:D-arabinose 1-dehydrogenase-like Zn-dependent alcohol dehydrogenase
LLIPNDLTITEAAALPEIFFTVWHNVFERGGLKTGESFLVHGGASGIGTTAIQLAKAFGAHIVTTASSDEKCDACLKLGADVAINYNTTDFAKEIRTKLPGKGVDVILDMVGGAVPRAEHLLLESRRPTREHRFFARIESRRGFHARDAETADLDRIDAAPAGHGVQGRHRVGA